MLIFMELDVHMWDCEMFEEVTVAVKLNVLNQVSEILFHNMQLVRYWLFDISYLFP